MNRKEEIETAFVKWWWDEGSKQFYPEYSDELIGMSAFEAGVKYERDRQDQDSG